MARSLWKWLISASRAYEITSVRRNTSGNTDDSILPSAANFSHSLRFWRAPYKNWTVCYSRDSQGSQVFKYVTPCPWTNSSCHFTSGSYGDHSAFSPAWPWIWRHYNVPKCPELVTQWHSVTTQMVSIVWNYLSWYQVIIWNIKLTDKQPTFRPSDKCTTTGCKSSKKNVAASDFERHFIMRLEALTVVLVFWGMMLYHNWMIWPFRAVQSHPVWCCIINKWLDLSGQYSLIQWCAITFRTTWTLRLPDISTGRYYSLLH